MEKAAEMREMRELNERVKSKVSVKASVEELVEGLAGLVEGVAGQNSQLLSAVNDLRARKTDWVQAVLDNTPAP